MGGLLLEPKAREDLLAQSPCVFKAMNECFLLKVPCMKHGTFYSGDHTEKSIPEVEEEEKSMNYRNKCASIYTSVRMEYRKQMWSVGVPGQRTAHD